MCDAAVCTHIAVAAAALGTTGKRGKWKKN